MSNIFIKQADRKTLAGGKLNRMALGHMAYALAGTREENIVEQTLGKLWQGRNNRFSHAYAHEAKLEGQTLGIVTCYPITLANRLAWPTFKKLLSARNWGLIGYHLLHPAESFSLLSLKEGHDDEFHIGTLATMPESRGLGVGSMLIKHAERLALSQGYSKSSLTVVRGNQGAFKLYERLGYRVTGEVNKPALSLFRMAKSLV
ncbi:GNAT family N-acetyltransferase [Paenibacillus sp. CAU 1782]